MSILAEPRRKANWVLNPRNTHWTADTSKFGLRLMEKMGWSQGNGLGANEQGSTEHVKVAVRSDNRGVGFKDRPEDVLLHQSEFSDLLQELASGTPPLEASGDESKSQVIASLEEKSQKSRSRVHYRKFTRGKDLSRYSEKDLASILGKPPPKTSATTAVIGDETTFQSDVVTVGGGNMLDYFRKKMTSFRMDGRAENSSTSEDVSVRNGENEVNGPEDNIETIEYQPIKRKKKSKKSLEDIEQETLEVELVNVKNTEAIGETKKEKKKRKKAEKALKNCEGNIDGWIVEVVENSVEDAQDKIAVKRKRKSKSASEECEQTEDNDKDVNDETVERKKRKRKHKKLTGAENETETESANNAAGFCSEAMYGSNIQPPFVETKKKSSKKSKKGSEQELVEWEVKDEVANEDGVKKKKKKKRTSESIQETPVKSDANLEALCGVETKKEKKRKRKFKEVLEEGNQEYKGEGEIEDENCAESKKEKKRKKRKLDCDESIEVKEDMNADSRASKRNMQMGNNGDHVKGNIVDLNDQAEIGMQSVESDVNESNFFCEARAKRKKKKDKKCKTNECPEQPTEETFEEMVGIVKDSEVVYENCASKEKGSNSKDSISIVELNGKVYLNGICNYELPQPAITSTVIKKIPYHMRSGVMFLPIPGANNKDFSYAGLEVNNVPSKSVDDKEVVKPEGLLPKTDKCGPVE